MHATRLASGLGRGLAALFALALVPGCPGDEEEDTGNNTTNPTTSTSGSGDGSGDDGENTTSGGGSGGGSSGDAGSDSTDPDTGGSTDDGIDTIDTLPDGTDGGNMCDPVVQGEWNECSPGGMTDNTLCNWMGLPDGVGFVGCLTSSEMKGYNVCMISGCEDTCDCFAPPATGTAEVICAEILADGGTACALDCSAGQTCPDGMECAGNICFHPA